MIAYPLSMVLHSFRKNKVFSFINIAGLAISMACCMVIGLYVLYEINYDRFHTNINRIVRVTEVQDQAGSLHPVAVTPGPLAPALAARFPEIENTVRFMKWGGIIKSGGQTFEEKNILMTDNSCFNVFSFKMIKGNPQTALAQPNEIVITEATAEKYFGANWASKSSIIGQVLKLNNEASFILAGVVKNLPAQSSFQFDILLPLSYLFATDSWSMKWNSNNYHTYLLLKPGTSQGMLQQKMAGLLANYVNGSKDQLRLQPLEEQYLQSSFDFMTDWGKRSNINYVKIFSGIGLLLLLIACVNFINLSTARAVKRSMEVGIRKVNGASRQQLLRQFLGESLIMTCMSAVLAILIINIASPWLTAITGFAIINSVNSPLLWCLLAAAVLIIGVLAGLYPAFFLSSFQPVTVLKKTGATGRGKSFRQWLVVGQFAIAVALITCTFFMYRQLRYMQQKDLGFSTAQLVTIRLGSALQEKSALLTAALLQLPGIVAAAPSTVNMANVDNGSYLEWQGMQPNDKFLTTQANIDPGFIPALGLQLLAGNNFTKQYANDTSRFIINESAVKRMGYTV
ncbi:MAG TPA: ABC transporter permease, partial [Chitinophagaceae bacterium]|nr:ABC transporter permease [Chitinophagaceae bacterium]